MCGIAGYFGEGSTDILQQMQQSLQHRGPDASGVLVRGKVGLAHRRLSILDVSERGAQPMVSDDEQVAISFNGEIFNFQELKEHYLKSHVFKGGSDTEVILRLYQELGESAFSKLQGMFAFALHDARTGQLFLVRDSLGKKPLYWSQTSLGTILFGSELKALRKHPECPTALDTTAIAQYLVFEYIPAPRTIYAGVQKLPAGRYLVCDGSTVEQRDLEPDRIAFDAEADPKETFMELMADSVQKRLVADVPVGVFLSGGLDSSAVAYFAQQAKADKIKTFSVGFTDKSFDEQADARLVAQHLGTEHFDILLGVDEIRKVIEDLPQVLDEPMADSSIVPTTLVSQFASDQVKVCLSGDGADELFHGYGTFYAHAWANRYRQVPALVRKGIASVVDTLPVSHSYMSLDFKLKRFLSGIEVEPKYQNAIWLSALTPEAVADISGQQLPTKDIFEQLDTWYDTAPTVAEGVQTEYLKGYLTEDILVKVDRATMRHGLEVRSPFLDERMVAFALSLGEEWKQRGKTGKYLIKSAMDAHLPSEIVWKKKKGFNIPIGRLIIEDMKDEFTTAILDGALVKEGLFQREKLAILLEQHWTGKSDYRKQIWSLYVLSRWLDTWHE